jgi:hypothetical protein
MMDKEDSVFINGDKSFFSTATLLDSQEGAEFYFPRASSEKTFDYSSQRLLRR